MSRGPGVSARIGQLYPSGGICEHEVQLMAPTDVRFLTTRVPFKRTGVADDLRFADAVVEHSELLAHAEVDLIAVNCTAATMMAGPGLTDAVTTRTGIDSVTTIDAVLNALTRMRIRRPALVTPYVAEVVQAEIAFLARHGVTVVRTAGLPCETPVAQGSITPEQWTDIVKRLPTDDVDGILISCAGIQIASAISRLEDLTALPVVTSNQALVWWVLKSLGREEEVPGYGRLLGSSSSPVR